MTPKENVSAFRPSNGNPANTSGAMYPTFPGRPDRGSVRSVAANAPPHARGVDGAAGVEACAGDERGTTTLETVGGDGDGGGDGCAAYLVSVSDSFLPETHGAALAQEGVVSQEGEEEEEEDAEVRLSSRAIPKSETRSVSSAHSKMFSSDRSRCTIPRSWQCETAPTIWRM